ncbi:ParB N-terminal domain-containing protein [Acinetobacter sp. ANC 5380]|uniref:ParB N-terminal domain-containing protein n=1 Tax=Acinetobacter terrae TaxID=2731247 RepID=A0A7Y2RCX3_9GAMM|nr:ParB N-terminal domain-containing protein [Acinetobacter terrae]NNH76483.1 ParB N-terminal domain-containing protein [Acinetobacter terrae]
MKRVKVTDLLKQTGGTAAPTSILTESTFDKVQSTEMIPLSQIYTKKRQVRFKINEAVVQSILETMPVQNPPSVRTRNPEIDHDVPEDFKYVVTAGHHRLEAMNRHGVKEADFILLPRHEVDTPQKIIYQQLTENLVKHDMHILEQAFSFMECLGYDLETKQKIESPTNGGLYQKDIAKAFNISASKGTVYRKIFMNLDQEDIDTIIEKNITIEASINYIACLKEIGINKWFELLEPYARDKDGQFNPKKLSGDLVKSVYESLLAGQKAEAEKKRALEEAAKQPTVAVEPGEHTQPVAQVEQPTTETKSVENTQPVATTPQAVETKQAVAQVEQPTTETKAVEAKQADVSPTPLTENPVVPKKKQKKEIRKSVLFTTSQGKDTVVDVRSLVVVFQELLSGQSVEELIESLGPNFADQITEADGQEIFEAANSLSGA